MGASIKIDIHRKSRALDAEITDITGAVTAEGVHTLLTDYHRNHASETYGGDLSATIARIDLESALNSRALTPRQRQVVALYYIAELTGEQTAQIIGVSRQAVEKSLKKACESLAAEVNGEAKQAHTLHLRIDESAGLTHTARWLDDVAHNRREWWRVPGGVYRELNAKFPPDDARFTADAGCELSEDAEYPHKNEYAMDYHARREGLRPVVWPVFDNCGTVSRGASDATDTVIRKKIRLVRAS